ncbi:MAG: saccharopine dehydrogenase NADP-binding domain-containing protein [Actinomycetota bacterium]
MRVLILGGTGIVGRRVAAELARNEEVTDLIIGGRNYEKIHRSTSLLGEKARAALLDLEDDVVLDAACIQADVVVNCCGPAHLTELPAARAAIEAGAAYVSLGDDYVAAGAVVGLAERAHATGSTAVVGCALSPGITTLFAALARDEFDDIAEIEISLAHSYRDLPTPAHTAHLLHMLGAPGASISDHELNVDLAGGSPHLVYFPEPVGWVEAVECSHPEIHNLKPLGLQSMSVRMGLTERGAMDALRALARTPLTSTSMAQRTLNAALALPPRGPRWSAARVDVVGHRGGHTATVSLGVVDHLINMAASSLTLAAVELGGRRHPSGVMSPAEAFDSGDFLARLGGRGTRVARLEPVPL